MLLSTSSLRRGAPLEWGISKMAQDKLLSRTFSSLPPLLSPPLPSPPLSFPTLSYHRGHSKPITFRHLLQTKMPLWPSHSQQSLERILPNSPQQFWKCGTFLHPGAFMSEFRDALPADSLHIALTDFLLLINSA